jgi:glycosyltransferase involved in cell wall biosynthesis
MDISESEMIAKKPFLTTHEKNYSATWCSRAVIFSGYEEYRKRSYLASRSSVVADLRWGWMLFRRSRHFRAVVTGSERTAFVFALLQRLRIRKVAHIFMQSMWDVGPSRIQQALRRFLLRIAVGSAARVVVYSKSQLVSYPAKFGLPSNKLVFVKSHTSLYDDTYPVSRGDYLFAGGDSNRDYNTLFQAVKELPHRVVVVTHAAEQLKKSWISENVELIPGLPRHEFNALMAGAAAVVITVKSGGIESGGRTVYSNAMALGKPVVVADDDASDYITTGFDGIVVPAGDVIALREALATVMQSSDYASRLAKNAQITAASLAPDVFFRSIFQLVDECS